MKLTKILMVLLLIILTIGTVSASENATADELSADFLDEEVLSTENQEILASGEGTFSDLAGEIASATGELNLSRNYASSGSDSEYITINKQITINGNGFIIDANNHNRTFKIDSDNVVLKNITFKNYIVKDSNDEYWDIYWNGNNGTLSDCSFVNCSAIGIFGGGAVYWTGAEGVIYDCSFVNCSADSSLESSAVKISANDCSVFNSTFENCSGFSGNAISLVGENGVVSGCSFMNCNSDMEGAVKISANDCSVFNCTFENCSGHSGNAISLVGENGVVSGCSFMNCNSDMDGAVEIIANISSVFNCTFENCSGYSGGALCLESENGVVFDCNFIKCSGYDGGAICWSEHVAGGKVSNCSFVNCSGYDGGAICWYSDDGIVSNCSFVNCSGFEGGAVYWVGANGVVSGCSFENCYADYNGGTIYWSGTGGKVKNSNFTKSSAEEEGIVIYVYTEEGSLTISESRFENNGVESMKDAVSGGTVSNSIFSEQIRPTSYVSVEEDSEEDMYTIVLPSDATGTIEVFVDEVSIGVLNIVNGIAKINLSQFKDGNYRITYKYSGDENYFGFTKELILTDYKINPKISAGNLKALYTAGKSYSVTVCDSNGNRISETMVVFKIGGKQVAKVKTNLNGVASFKITKVPGTYKMTATALGLTVKKTLTVTHLVTLKKVTVKKSAKKLVLTATLSKVNGKYLKNKKITFKFNGKKYSAKTTSKGVAKVTIKSSVLKKLKVGKKITYQATYLKDTIKKSVKVKK